MFKGTVSSKMKILFACSLFMSFHPYSFYFVSSAVHKGKIFQHNYNKWGAFKDQKDANGPYNMCTKFQNF